MTHSHFVTVVVRVRVADAGMRLDDFLARDAPAACGAVVSRSTIRRAIVAGAVIVDRLCVRSPAWRLNAGSRVKARLDASRLDPHLAERRTAESTLDVVYEDEWLLVVNKPPGLPTHATADPERPNLVGVVREYLRAAYVGVHQRLDRDTSGLVLFTKASGANHAIAEQFASRDVRKVYLALVARPPELPPRHWVSEAPILANGAVHVSRRRGCRLLGTCGTDGDRRKRIRPARFPRSAG